MISTVSALSILSLVGSFVTGANALYRRDPYYSEDSLQLRSIHARNALEAWLEDGLFSREADFDALYGGLHDKRDADSEYHDLFSRDPELEYYDIYAREAEADLWDLDLDLFERDLYEGSELGPISKRSNLIIKALQPMKDAVKKALQEGWVRLAITNKNVSRPKDPITEVTIV